MRLARSVGWSSLGGRELWAYRELVLFLAWRDVKVRYKQTALGAAWAILQPVFTMLIFWAVFGRLARIPTDGVAYPLFAFAALLPWQLFSTALTQTSMSLVAQRHVVTKVYFPRLAVPLSTVVSGLVDFAVASSVFMIMLAVYGVTPTWAFLALPAILALTIATALGVGLWLCALNVQYRDFQYTLPFLTQAWLFATPVAYPTSLVPEQWRLLFGLNPLVGVVEGFRWALLGTPPPDPLLVGVSSAMVLVVLVTGLLYFRRVERTIADTL